MTCIDILNVKLKLPGSVLARGNCATDIFMPVDLALGGSIDRNMRGMRCVRAKGLNLAETFVMKFEIMVVVGGTASGCACVDWRRNQGRVAL